MVRKLITQEFFRKHRLKYIVGFIALLATSLLQVVVPRLLGIITDSLKTRSRSYSDIAWLTLAMFAISLLVFGLKFVWRYCISGRARDLECFLREKLFAHMQTLDADFYNEKKTGDLMAYAINDLNAVRRAFAFGLNALIDGVVLNVASLFVMVKVLNSYLTLATLGPVIVAVAIVIKLRPMIRKRFTKVQEAFANISEKVQENISGIRVVKGYVQEEAEVQKIREVSKNRMKAQMDYIRLSASFQPAVQICFSISFAITIILGSYYVSTGAMSLGDFIAFDTYLAMLIVPVRHIGRIVEVWQNAFASIRRLDDIFNRKPRIVDIKNPVRRKRLRGDLKIRNLTFAFPGSEENVLEDINIDLEPGKTLAVIGRTGSGKTTLANLLLRVYSVDRGKIFIDDTDINDISLADLRENIGYVPQDNFLFSATIKDNIKFFSDMFTDEEVEEASRMASVYDNIIEFPDGFETVVGERGVTLSGGQKQRVSIARAIIKDPAILILDDSLSAVDTRTEEEILANIKKVLAGRTGIIIAHRISTIKHVDEIIVLDKGRIVERGTHEELLTLGGQYWNLYNEQMEKEDLRKTGGMIG